MSKILITAIASVAILYQGYSLMNDYNTKANAQMIENNGVVSLRETWTTLQPEVSKWNELFPLDAEIKDLNGVYKAINIEKHNLRSESLMLNDSGRDIVKHQESVIGLSRTCLTNSNSGFVLKNEFVSQYIKNLKPLLLRKDIEFGSISMRIDADKDFRTPYVVFDKLCVVMRGSDTFLEGLL